MSKITDAEANATSLDGLVNDNALVPTLRNGPKPSYQYLVDGWNTEFDVLIDNFEAQGVNAITSINADVVSVEAAKNSAISSIDSDLSVFDAYYQSARDAIGNDVAEFTIDSDAALADFAQESAEAFNEFDLTLDQYKESRGFNTKGTFADGFTYELPNDVGLDADGNPWIYNGSLPFTVTAGSTPTSPTYTQVVYGSAAQVSMNTSDTVQSFADSFALKIFQSPTDGGLTEIQTRTVNGGEVYEVRKTSDDSFATIYSDAASPTEILQNGIDNKSGSDGVVEFFVSDGDYYIYASAVRSDFSTLTTFSNVDEMVSFKGHSIGLKYSTGVTSWLINESEGLSLASGLFAKPLNGSWLVDFDLSLDGSSDDDAKLELWLSSGVNIKGWDVTINYGGAGLEKSVAGDFKIDGMGLKITVTDRIYKALSILHTGSETESSISIKNITIDGSGNAADGLYITTESKVSSIELENVTTFDFDNADLPLIVSTSGISVVGDADKISICKSSAKDVSRTQVNASIVSSSGVKVFGATGVVVIDAVVVDNVTSPTGDADADGIVVFGDESRLITPAQDQKSNTTITNCNVKSCKGRIVKLQIANFKVFNNYFDTDSIDVVTNFKVVDAQIGGGNMYDNTVRVGDLPSPDSLSVFGVQSHEYGGNESAFNIHNNTIIITSNIPYLLQCSIDEGTKTSIKLHDNIAVSEGGSYNVINTVYFAGLPESADSFNIEVKDNEIPVGSGALFWCNSATSTNWGDATKGPIMSGYISIVATGNKNTLENSACDIFNAANVVPYLQNIVISNNPNFGRASLTVKGIDIFNLPDGNSFYYNNDGSVGGLINAPTGYTRDVAVETFGLYHSRITKFAGVNFVVGNKSLGSFYEYTGLSV